MMYDIDPHGLESHKATTWAKDAFEIFSMFVIRFARISSSKGKTNDSKIKILADRLKQ